MQWLLLSSFGGSFGNSKYIVSHISLTMYILLLFKYFSSWTGFLLHFQGCVLFSRKCICWSIYSAVGYSSWILNVICCDIRALCSPCSAIFFSSASVKLFAVFQRTEDAFEWMVPSNPNYSILPWAFQHTTSL